MKQVAPSSFCFGIQVPLLLELELQSTYLARLHKTFMENN